jgi:Tfp pilus assembly pilus retraction ATPase PilT
LSIISRGNLDETELAFKSMLCYTFFMTLIKHAFDDFATLTELGHGEDVSALASTPTGVILVSGKQGSGKSTTLKGFAKEIQEKTGLRSVEITAEKKSELGFPYFTLEDRPYTRITKGSKVQDVDSARRFALLESAAFIKEGVQVAVFDDIRHAESALIASHLATAGVLVLASIHNSGEPQDAVEKFLALPGRLTATPLDKGIVQAVVHQSLVRDGEKATLSSQVVK